MCSGFTRGVALLAIAVALPACGSTELGSFAELFFSLARSATSPSGKKAPKNLYFAIRSKTNGRQIAELRVPGQELHAPFRIEARIGDFSKKQTPWNEANERLFVTDPNFRTSSHLLRMTFDETGGTTAATVTVSAEVDQQMLPDLQLVLPDTRLVDIALEHTGTELIFFAKRADAAVHTEIGRVGTTYIGPFVFTFDAFGLPKKAEAGIDDIVVVNRTAPPDLDTAQKRAAHASTQALDDLLLAMKAVDGLADDAATAKSALADAGAHLETARTELNAVDGKTRKAAKSLATATKKANAALKKLNKNKAPSSTVKLLKTAIQKAGIAIALIRDG